MSLERERGWDVTGDVWFLPCQPTASRSGKKCTWQRATMSKWWAKMSTSLPLPSSPHWQPNTPNTWLRDPIQLVPWVVLDLATLRDAEVEAEEQMMRFGRRGRIMGLRWWWRAPKKGVCGTLIGFESSANDERLMLRHWDGYGLVWQIVVVALGLMV